LKAVFVLGLSEEAADMTEDVLTGVGSQRSFGFVLASVVELALPKVIRTSVRSLGNKAVTVD
jgi:hypothetical protein